MSRRALVTGGCGFVGGHVVDKLLERGDRVRVLDIAPPPVSGHQADVEYMRGSVTDSGAVQRAMRGVDQVFHLAASAELWSRDRGVYERVNHQGTRIVLGAALKAGVEWFVHTSSMTTLADALDGAMTAGELSQVCPTSPDSARAVCPYTRSKLRAEQAALEAHRQGLPVVVVSLPAPIGPGDHRFTPPTRMLLGFLNGVYPAYMESSMNLADVRDLARGHLRAVERGAVGRRYLLAGESFKLSQILVMLEELTGLRMPRLQLPMWVALAAARVNELLARMERGRTPTATVCGVRLARAEPVGFDRTCRREIGYCVRPARESLADAIRWFAAEGLLRRTPTRSL